MYCSCAWSSRVYPPVNNHRRRHHRRRRHRHPPPRPPPPHHPPPPPPHHHPHSLWLADLQDKHDCEFHFIQRALHDYVFETSCWDVLLVTNFQFESVHLVFVHNVLVS